MSESSTELRLSSLKDGLHVVHPPLCRPAPQMQVPLVARPRNQSAVLIQTAGSAPVACAEGQRSIAVNQAQSLIGFPRNPLAEQRIDDDVLRAFLQQQIVLDERGE